MTPAFTKHRAGWVALTVYAAAMALVEAACVVTLKRLYFPEGWAPPFHPIPAEGLRLEEWREVATLVMIAAVSCLGRPPLRIALDRRITVAMLLNHTSGLADYFLNTILQKTFSDTAVHVNAGIQFSGNTQTGVVGIRTPGHIFIGGLSAARDFSQRLRLGLDVNGAEIHAAGRVDKQLQLTAGGNYALTSNDTLDFAVLTGWFNGPRFGLILGISVTP